MATINLPAVDSDVNVLVNAMNVFGSGPDSNESDIISKLYTYVLHTHYLRSIAYYMCILKSIMMMHHNCCAYIRMNYSHRHLCKYIHI